MYALWGHCRHHGPCTQHPFPCNLHTGSITDRIDSRIEADSEPFKQGKKRKRSSCFVSYLPSGFSPMRADPDAQPADAGNTRALLKFLVIAVAGRSIESFLAGLTLRERPAGNCMIRIEVHAGHTLPTSKGDAPRRKRYKLSRKQVTRAWLPCRYSRKICRQETG